MAKTDFSKGPVWKCILTQALPLTIAQLAQLLYNIIDRIYLGHMEGGDSIALTGVGLTFPIVTLIAAFTALFGNGGVPLFSMARGAGNEARANKIMGNAFALLLCAAGALTALCYLFAEPILFAFGASEESYQYANAYLRIYLAGTAFSMLSTGMNGYINAQGFPKIGMLTVLLGAVTNIILDPIFILYWTWGSPAPLWPLSSARAYPPCGSAVSCSVKRSPFPCVGKPFASRAASPGTSAGWAPPILL